MTQWIISTFYLNNASVYKNVVFDKYNKILKYVHFSQQSIATTHTSWHCIKCNKCPPPSSSFQSLMPLLKKSVTGDKTSMSPSKACVVMISSKAASIGDNKLGRNYIYRGSKVSVCPSIYVLKVRVSHEKKSIYLMKKIQ